MVMRKTMAILGDTGSFFPEVFKVLMKQDLRLLLVFENESKKLEISRHLELENTTAEIEFLSCERDGCWEADMIVLMNPDISSASLVERIKEVATQKIVLVISEDKELKKEKDLRDILPWSKVVELILNTRESEISLCSTDTEAKAEVQQLFRTSGYHIK